MGFPAQTVDGDTVIIVDKAGVGEGEVLTDEDGHKYSRSQDAALKLIKIVHAAADAVEEAVEDAGQAVDEAVAVVEGAVTDAVEGGEAAAVDAIEGVEGLAEKVEDAVSTFVDGLSPEAAQDGPRF